MKELIFKVKGSASKPYTVSFKKNHNNINASCTCPAGENGKHCKHRLAIMAGDSKSVVCSNKNQVTTIQLWLPGSDLGKTFVELTSAEHEYKKAKQRLTIAKKRIADTMKQHA